MNGGDIQIHKLVIVSGRSHSISEALTVLLAAGRVFYSSLINCCYMFVFFGAIMKKLFFFLHGKKKLKFRVGLKLCPIKGPTNCFSSSIFLTQMCVPLETNSSKFFCRKYFSGRLHFPPMNLCGFGVPRSGCRSHLKDPRAGGLPTLPTQKKSERQKSHFRTRRLPTPPVGT